MGNLYKNWGKEQRLKWNEYNRNYSKSHFKTITIKLSLDKDKDVISYLEKNKDLSFTQVVRNGVRKLIESEK